ncbi:MAG TPA: LamG domain-containing protein, partial [Sedimentisphaerales bacterium]|nr:LamG domain-containing protein [Sedimentisphaerales bacterium]
MGSCVKKRNISFLQVVIFFVFTLFSISLASTDPNLVGWWKFDEGAGQIAHDSSGYGNHFTLILNEGYKTDPTYVKSDDFVPGVSGYCLQLDGKWKTAYTPHDDVLKPAKEMTISVWLKADVLEKTGNIYFKSDGGDYGAAANIISIEKISDNYKFRFTLNAGGTRRRVDAPITVAGFADNQWHLYTCTYDGNYMKTYRDGVVIAQLNCPGEIGVCGRSNAYLGSCANYCPTDNPGIAHYDGLMDDLRIYDRALTQQEIEVLMGISKGAVEPSPMHGEKSVRLDSILSWKGSGEAESFDVYLGTDAQSVEDANASSDEFMGNQSVDVNSFDPNVLESGVFYYWRVDEVSNANVIKGQVWSFETVGNVDENLIGWWTFDEEVGNLAFDSSGNGNHATIAGSSTREAGATGNAVVFYGDEEYALVPNESTFDISGDLTLSAWVKMSSLDSSSMYIVSKSDSFFFCKDVDMETLTFYCAGTGRPVLGKIDIVDGKWHHVAAVHEGMKKSIYVDGRLDKYVTTTSSVITVNNNPLCIGADGVWPDTEFNGSIDDVRVYNRALAASEVMSLAGVRFSFAYDPEPANNTKYVPINKTLSWHAGNYATSHDVYFGRDSQAVLNADSSSAEYMGNQTSNSYLPSLELNTTYYWRVDEVDGSEIYKGNLWSFTTADELPDSSLIGCWKFDTGYGYT